MRITEEMSVRIEAVRYPLIVAIVFFHADQTQIRFRDGTAAYTLDGIPAFITSLFDRVAFTALPLFFLISGLLFYKGFQPTLAVYGMKLRKRLRSLVVPYLFWNICVFSGLLIVQHIWFLSPFFSGGKWVVPESGVYAIVNAIIGIDRMPILYPFWFLRDLILLMILSPLLWILATRAPFVGVLIFTFLWFAENAVPMIIFPNHYDGPLFFYCGCLLANNDVTLESIERRRGIILILYSCALFLTASIKTVNGDAAPFWMNLGATNAWQVALFKFTDLLGILAFWNVVTSLKEKTRRSLASLSIFAFILYAGHEPMLNIVRKLLYRFAPPSGQGGVLLYYFLTVGITIFVMLLVGILLTRHAPRFHEFLTGARSRALQTNQSDSTGRREADAVMT